MNAKYIIQIAITVIILNGLESCKKQVELGPPPTQVMTSNVFSSDYTATAAQLSIYAQMQNYPFNLHRATALSSDEISTSAIDQTSKNLYTNALDAATDGGTLNMWSPAYSYIYQANAIVEGLQTYNGVSERAKKQLTGESIFIRAFFYFNLVNLYDDVPLVLSTDYKVNSVLGRSSKEQIYRQIVDDLKRAASLLNSNYVDPTDTVTTADRIRPTSWAAAALLAKAYLYMGKYDSAEIQSSNVISNTPQFTLPSDLTKVFLKNSPEAIWQIGPAGSSLYTIEGNFFILTATPGTGSSNSSIISSQLLNAFEPNDQRRVSWIKTYSSGANSWNYPGKYKDNNKTSTLNEYTMMLRLADQYLIRAEARVQQGNSNAGIDDLNVIRKRAGLSNYSGPTDKATLLNAISHERQVELFMEGDRWMNLKRVGVINDVMGGTTGVCKAKGGTWDAHSQLYPIPVADILNNVNIIQNKGY